MKTNKEEQKKAFTSLFDSTSNDIIQRNIVENMKEEQKPIMAEVQKEIELKKRTYNIPSDILEDMEKIVYMDRDIKDNTDLLIKALRYYLNTEDCKNLLNEYNIIKGGQKQ